MLRHESEEAFMDVLAKAGKAKNQLNHVNFTNRRAVQNF
jgi:hypothetical protein